MNQIFSDILIFFLLIALAYCLWKMRKMRVENVEANSGHASVRAGEEEILKLRQVVEQYPVSVVIADAEGIIEYVNPQFSAQTGWSSRQILGKHLEFLAAGYGNKDLFNEMWATVTRGDNWRGEFCKEEKGKKCWGLMSIGPVRNDDGAVNSYFAFIENITERKQMMEEINRSHQTQIVLNKILNISLEDISLNELLTRALEIVMKGSYVRLGKSALIMLADNEKSLLKIAAHIDTSEKKIGECHSVPFGSCICGKVAEKGEIEFTDCRANAEKMRCTEALPQGLYSLPVLSNSRLLAVLSVYLDEGLQSDEKEIAFLRLVAATFAGIIEKKFGEEALEKARMEAVLANKAKSDFLANMSHEFRTPLNAVIGFSEMLILGVGGLLNEKQVEFAKDIHESGENLLLLINDILDLSKVKSGKLELDYSCVRMQDLIKKSFLFIRQRSDEKGLKLTSEFEEGIGSIYCDERRIKQVIIYLLTNAVKFTNEGEIVVRLSLKKKDAMIEVCIEDSGIGIKAEDLLMLFQPFKQVETGYARNYEGSGLGLALCKTIINSHEGEIWAESTFGKGSRFIFTLPVRRRT